MTRRRLRAGVLANKPSAVETFWLLSIAAQILASLVGYLGRSGFRRVPLFLFWISLDAASSIGMFWLNAHGHKILYRDVQNFKWAFIIVPGACLATSEAVAALHLYSLRWVWVAAPASLFIAVIANRPRVWPSSDQELVFTALATVDSALAFVLAFAITSENASTFAKRHAGILCAYLGMNALGYFGASLYFPLIGRGLMLGSFLAWMAWVWLFARDRTPIS